MRNLFIFLSIIFFPSFSFGDLIKINDGSIISFSGQTLSESWTNEEYLRRGLSNATEYDGNVVFGDIEGYLHVINPLTGRTVGREKISSNPIRYVSTRGNQLFALDSELRMFALN